MITAMNKCQVYSLVGFVKRGGSLMNLHLLIMAESNKEFLTVVHCSCSLETALKDDRDIVYYLQREGFITADMCDQVLNPRSLWTAAEKAGQLVAKIRDRVKHREYHKLVSHFSQNWRQYGNIVDILNTDYSRLGGTGKHQLLVRCSILAS